MHDILLRTAQLNDLAQILQLFVTTIKHTCSNDYNSQQFEAWISSAKNKDIWINRIKNQYFLIAEINNQIVGFASLENKYYVDLLYLHKDYLKQGIACELYKRLEQIARESGKSEIESDVSITAVPFFEKMGFRMVHENRILLQGVKLINYRMSKQI